MSSVPNPPPYLTRASNWLRRLQQAVMANRILPTPTIKVSRSSSGTSLHVIGGSGPISGPWLVKSVEGQYLVCHSFDADGNEGTEDVKIAKIFELRDDVDSETIDGTEILYSDYDNDAQTRLADDGTTQETQVIVPRYIPDQTRIFACRANSLAQDEDENFIGLLDINAAGRAWAVTSSS